MLRAAAIALLSLCACDPGVPPVCRDVVCTAGLCEEVAGAPACVCTPEESVRGTDCRIAALDYSDAISDTRLNAHALQLDVPFTSSIDPRLSAGTFDVDTYTFSAPTGSTVTVRCTPKTLRGCRLEVADDHQTLRYFQSGLGQPTEYPPITSKGFPFFVRVLAADQGDLGTYEVLVFAR